MFGNGYTLGATEKGSKWRHFACVPWFCKKIIWLETIHSRFRTPLQKKRGEIERGEERERECVCVRERERERVTLVENRVWCDNIDTTAVGNGADTGDISLLNQLFLFCFFISRTKTTSLTRSTLCSRRQLPTLTYEGWSSWPRSTGLVYRPARQIPDRTARDPQCPAPSAGRVGWRWEWPPVRSSPPFSRWQGSSSPRSLPCWTSWRRRQQGEVNIFPWSPFRKGKCNFLLFSFRLSCEIKNRHKVKQNAFWLDDTREDANFKGNLLSSSHKHYKNKQITHLLTIGFFQLPKMCQNLSCDLVKMRWDHKTQWQEVAFRTSFSHVIINAPLPPPPIF